MIVTLYSFDVVDLITCISLSAGDAEELGRTHEYLVNSVKSKANVCLICIETVKRNDPVSTDSQSFLVVPTPKSGSTDLGAASFIVVWLWNPILLVATNKIYLKPFVYPQ